MLLIYHHIIHAIHIILYFRPFSSALNLHTYATTYWNFTELSCDNNSHGIISRRSPLSSVYKVYLNMSSFISFSYMYQI